MWISRGKNKELAVFRPDFEQTFRVKSENMGEKDPDHPGMGHQQKTVNPVFLLQGQDEIHTAPLHLAESWDNCGLQVGQRQWPVKHIRTALDPLPQVAADAAKAGVEGGKDFYYVRELRYVAKPELPPSGENSPHS